MFLRQLRRSMQMKNIITKKKILDKNINNIGYNASRTVKHVGY